MLIHSSHIQHLTLAILPQKCLQTSALHYRHIKRLKAVMCPVHTDFVTHFGFLDFQGKSIRTNLISFFPLTTKGAKSFHKIHLSFIT